jgi:LssY C-terminus
MAIEAIPARRIRPMGLMAFATAVFIGMGLFHITTRLNQAEARYAARTMVQTFTAEQWSNGGWEKLADRRIDLAGISEEVFTAQWIGSLAQLESAMTAKGWKPSPSWRWQDAFSYLDTNATLDKLPPRPVLHQGLKAKLTLTLENPLDPGRRLVLRAFKAYVDVTVDGQQQPVYLLSVTPEAPRARFHLYAMPSTLPSDAKDRQTAMSALSSISDIRILASSENPLKPSKVLLAKP